MNLITTYNKMSYCIATEVLLIIFNGKKCWKFLMKNWDCKIDCCIYECSRKITETWPANQATLRSVWMWIMTGDIKLQRTQFVWWKSDGQINWKLSFFLILNQLGDHLSSSTKWKGVRRTAWKVLKSHNSPKSF